MESNGEQVVPAIRSSLYEEYPVIDVDLYLTNGEIKDLTLKDGVDSYKLDKDKITIHYASNDERLVFYLRFLAGYSIRKRTHRRKIEKPITAPPDPTTPPTADQSLPDESPA